MGDSIQQEIHNVLGQPGLAYVAHWIAQLRDRCSDALGPSQDNASRALHQTSSSGDHLVSVFSRLLGEARPGTNHQDERDGDNMLLTSLKKLRSIAQYAESLEEQLGDGSPNMNRMPTLEHGIDDGTDFVHGYQSHWHQSQQPPVPSSPSSPQSPPRFGTTSSPRSTIYGQQQQYGYPQYIIQQQPSFAAQDSNESYSYTHRVGGLSYPYADSPAASSPRAIPRFGHPAVSDPLGLRSAKLPHIYQTSALRPMVMHPRNFSEHIRNSASSRDPASPSPMMANQASYMPSTSITSQSEHDKTTKALYETFKQPLKPKRFFRTGRVFMILWTEPLGNESLSETSQYTLKGLYGDWLHQKVRRFIVIGEAERHCLVIPILSYGNKGVAKQGLNKADHGIVYVGSKAPDPDREELPVRGEMPMVEIPIRVDPDSVTEKLGLKSRIHYSKVYTIEHNVKARSVGMIHNRSLPDLLYQTKLVWSRTGTGLGQLDLIPRRTMDHSNNNEGQNNHSISADIQQQQEVDSCKGSSDHHQIEETIESRGDLNTLLMHN